MTVGVPRERPTAAFTVRDLSAPPGRASAPPEGHRARASLATTEDMRPLDEITARWAWRRLHPAEDCVCGGEVRAESGLDIDILAAVQRHQIEPLHIAWDRAHGIPLASWQVSALAIDAGVR